jgi:hypothetical protein
MDGCHSQLETGADHPYIREMIRNIIEFEVDGKVPEGTKYRKKPSNSLTVG